MPSQTKQRKTYPQAYQNMVDDILACPPGPRRWKMAAAAWLHLNPSNDDGFTAREATYRLIQQNQRTKQAHVLSGNKFASSDSMTTRAILNIPTGMMTVIELFDPQAFATKENVRLMAKTFPQFTEAEKI